MAFSSDQVVFYCCFLRPSSIWRVPSRALGRILLKVFCNDLGEIRQQIKKNKKPSSRIFTWREEKERQEVVDMVV
ncbi:hypothetical protein Bca101_094145 [Brassica carinata]